mmetsp:Transcript_104981/g.172598  ORF Transcript_104981/g.172598 Transcript_104981/m.172598 type:complete len:139 (+) Transcript_104981:43-459(+)
MLDPRIFAHLAHNHCSPELPCNALGWCTSLRPFYTSDAPTSMVMPTMVESTAGRSVIDACAEEVVAGLCCCCSCFVVVGYGHPQYAARALSWLKRGFCDAPQPAADKIESAQQRTSIVSVAVLHSTSDGAGCALLLAA